MEIHPRLRGLARLTFGNAASLSYLGLVAASVVFVVIDAAFVSHPDASMAGVWPVLLTFPTVFLPIAAESLIPGGDLSAALLLASVPVAALVQAAMLGWFVRALRHRPSSRSAYGRG